MEDRLIDSVDHQRAVVRPWAENKTTLGQHVNLVFDQRQVSPFNSYGLSKSVPKTQKSRVVMGMRQGFRRGLGIDPLSPGQLHTASVYEAPSSDVVQLKILRCDLVAGHRLSGSTPAGRAASRESNRRSEITYLRRLGH